MGDERPESPLRKLTRLLGGVVLTRGRLGHQVLGQILITNFTQPEFAGAALVGAAASRQRNVFAQAAVSTAVPALALNSLIEKAERRLARREEELTRREEELEARLAAAEEAAQSEEEKQAKEPAELKDLKQTYA